MKCDPRRWTCIVAMRAIVAAAVALLAATPGWAQFAVGTNTWASGGVAQGTGSGLKVIVDTTWLVGHGYRPARIEVTPVTPPIADRTLTVELLCTHQWGTEGKIIVGRDIEVPAGSGPITVEMPVPEHFVWGTCEFRVWEDGSVIKGLSFNLPSTGNYRYGWEEALPKIVFVSSTSVTPDSGILAQALPAAQYAQQYGNVATTAGANGAHLPTLGVFGETTLPENWLDYTGMDVVCLSLDQLRQLAAGRPAAWQAIRRWTAAGGNLWVFGMGTEWSGLPELEQLLALEPNDGTASDPVERGWMLPELRHRGTVQTAYGHGEYGNGYVEERVVDEPPDQAIKPADGVQPAITAHFVSRPLAQGLVVALAPQELFPGTQADWGWLLNHMQDDRYLWGLRHGMSLERENQDFWNWLIPGVRLAPVTAFRVLITLFVLAIGPLNYWWLWKRGRLHLLLVVVPLAALVITGGLFAYAIVADGLGVRARVRSYTEIDQKQGEAICWSRMSYYAGLAPYGGMTFPDDVAVVPLPAGGPDSGDHPAALSRGLDWTSDGQRMVHGWLSARTPTQYLTLRSRKTEHSLQIAEQPGGPPRIENRLGTRVRRLLLVASDGSLFSGTDIPQGASVELAPAQAVIELEAIRLAIREQLPLVPDGIEPGQQRGWFGSYSYYYNYGRSDLPPSLQGTGRLERGIFGVTALQPDQLRPRSYVAIVDRSGEVELGLEAQEEPASLHVVVGSW